MNSAQEFHPSKFRYFMWMVGGLAFMTILVIVLEYALRGYVTSLWLNGLIVATVLMTLRALAYFQNYRVSIMEDSISGPSVGATSVVSFKFEQIDRKKTMQQTALERLEGSRSIYSVSGKRIALSGWVFNGAQIRAILNLIGYGESK